MFQDLAGDIQRRIAPREHTAVEIEQQLYPVVLDDPLDGGPQFDEECALGIPADAHQLRPHVFDEPLCIETELFQFLRAGTARVRE